MANEFESQRARKGAFAVGWGIVLWIAGIVGSMFLGVAIGIGLGLLLAPFGGGSAFEVGFSVGWFATFVMAFLGYPIALIMADRLVPWAIGAREADQRIEDEHRLVHAVESAAIAAGVVPLVLVVEADWVDATALGRRGDRHVAVMSTAAAGLDRRCLEMLAAAVIADEIDGRGASRARLAAGGPALVVVGIARLLRQALAHRGVALASVGALLAIGFTAGLRSVDESGNQNSVGVGLMAGPFFALLVALVLLVILGVAVAFLATLTVLAIPISRRAERVADLGMASIVRDPQQWADHLTAAGRRSPRTPVSVRLIVDWVLPHNTRQAQRRLERLLTAIPAARYSLGEAR